MKLISVVIPVYRNEGSLELSYNTILHEIKQNLPEYNYEFIFVDDGSDDGSLAELIKIHNKDKKVTIIKFSRNFGQFSALNAGMQHASGDATVCISADLQDPADLIPKMARKIEEGNQIVLAIREARNDNFIKNLTASLHIKLIRISNPSYPMGGFDYWMMGKKALNAYQQLNDIVRSNQVDILSLGFKIAHLPYERKKREIGKSQYNFSKRLRTALNQLLSTSYWPLRMASSFGIVVTSIGFIYAFRIIFNYFLYDMSPFKGWAPIMIIQLILGGIIILMLGIIGEYLWRIYLETKKRPLFIVDEIYAKDADKRDDDSEKTIDSSIIK